MQALQILFTIWLTKKMTPSSLFEIMVKPKLGKLFPQLMIQFNSVQLLSHVRLSDLMDCSMPDFSVHHQLPELAQIHVHRVNDAIQPSHSLSSPSLPALNLSQHQGQSSPMSQFFASGGQSIGVSASVLSMNIQDRFPLGLTKRQEVNVKEDVEKRESFMHSWWKCKLVQLLWKTV